MWLNMAELKPPFPPWQLLLLGFFLGVSAGVQADDLSLGGSPEAAPGKPRELSYSEFYVGLYGPGRRFDVLRKGRRIGSYDMAFRSLGKSWRYALQPTSRFPSCFFLNTGLTLSPWLAGMPGGCAIF